METTVLEQQLKKFGKKNFLRNSQEKKYKSGMLINSSLVL